jgi:hypothetical protein
MTNIKDNFGIYQIDSGRFYFDKDLFRSVNIPDKFILTDAESGEIVDEFKRNSLSLPFGTHKIYVTNVVKTLGNSNQRFLIEKVMLYFSPKIKGDYYWSGIDKTTLEQVLFYLNEKGYLIFDDIDKIIEGCYVKDLDIKIDWKLPKESKEEIEEYYNSLKDRFNGNPDNFRHFQNKKKEGHGIVCNNRNTSTTKNPFFKFYDKSIELLTRANEEFYSILSHETKEILRTNFIWRYEFQLKDKRHFEYYGLSNRFIDIISINQAKWKYVGKSILGKAFQKQIRVVDTSKLKLMDRAQINLITYLLYSGKSYGAIQQLYMKAAQTKQEKYRIKKMFDKFYNMASSPGQYQKEAIAVVERISKWDNFIGIG